MRANVDYIYWDREGSSDETQRILNDSGHPEFAPTLAHLLREAKPGDVWTFVSPATVAAALPLIGPKLGRKRAFWSWLIDEWRRRGLV